MAGVLAGCAALRRRGDDVTRTPVAPFEAADVLRPERSPEDPKDDEARAGRARARDAALTELVGQSAASCARTADAAESTRPGSCRCFRLRRNRIMPTPPALVAEVGAQVGGGRESGDRRINPAAARRRRSAGCGVYADRRKRGVVDEPELTAAAPDKLQADIAAAGRKSVAMTILTGQAPRRHRLLERR